MAYTPLSPNEHADLKFTPGTFFHFKDRQVIPVSTREAARACLDLPLAFVRDDKKMLKLVAILSLDPHNNVSIGPLGKWMGGYMPAIMRAHPFTMAVQDGKGHIMADLQSDWISREKGTPLFNADSSLSQLLNNKIAILKNWVPNPVRDNPVLEAINGSEVLVPWSEISENLLRIDREKMGNLDDRKMLSLIRNHALPVMYAQMISMPRVGRLKNLSTRKEKLEERQAKVMDNISLDWEQDDIIRFD